MSKVEVSARTVEDAVAAACLRLGVPRSRLGVQVLQEPKKGFLGLFAKPARILAERIDEDPVEAAVRFLTGVAGKLGVQVELDVEARGSSAAISIRVQSGEAGLLIGKRGLTLAGLEHLTNIAANRRAQKGVRILLDVADYRKRREESLAALADRMALEAVRTGRDVELEPMPKHERKLIHRRVKKMHRLKTRSIGEEPNRRVVILAKS